jgi:hypothetical protein
MAVSFVEMGNGVLRYIYSVSAAGTTEMYI